MWILTLLTLDFNFTHMFFLPFLCSAIPDLGILNMLIRACFPDVLQPAVDDDCRLTHVHHTLLNVRRAFGAPAIEKWVVSACRPAIIITITVNDFFNTGKCLVKRITSSGIVWL